MKLIRLLTIALLTATLLGSCNKENDTPNTADGTAVQFTTVITRASGAAWDNGDKIGVFMTTAGQALSGSNLADNVQYTNSGSGFTTTTPIYYPQAGAVDFVAYYPYRTTPNPDPYIYKVDVGNQTSPANIDLLYASKSDVAKSSTAVPLVFDHKLSQVVLNIEKGVGMATVDLSTIKITIAGMPTKVDFKLADGGFVTASDVADLTPRTLTAGEKYDAIVIPQAANSYMGRTMVFTVGADVYEYALPNGDDFVSGKSYAYTVTVAKTGVTVSASTITDWTGTTETPGDLGEAAQLPIPMVLIPAGTFMMGSPDGEPNKQPNETQHAVTLTKDYYMSKYAITFAQYDAYCTAISKTPPNDNNWGRGDRPVINVTWTEAVAYCTWLSDQTGGTWRLPTEAEWEYAARGAYDNKATEVATKPFGLGDGSKLYADMANFNGGFPYDVAQNGHISNYDGLGGYPNTNHAKTMPVGSYASNNYGLYDMHGNVYEWCSDWYGSYGSDAVTDPTGPNTGSSRVRRGGSWNNSALLCRSAYRYHNFPGDRNLNVGFRVVFVP